MTELCYLCGFRTANPLHKWGKILDKYFTEHNKARSPHSATICDFCRSTLSKGEQGQLWYWHPTKQQYSKLFGRSLSRLYQGETLLSPIIKGTHTENGVTLLLVENLATRVEIRGWLINPPDPPFLINIAESGQKHTVIWAQQGHDRDRFPVQFESDSLYVDRAEFIRLLEAFELLMGLGFSKTEITTGDYHSDRLVAAFVEHQEPDSLIQRYRNTRLLDLVNHVAQKPEEVAEEYPQISEEKAIAPLGQLSLF